MIQAVAAVEEKKASKTEREPSAYDLNTFTTWLLKVVSPHKTLQTCNEKIVRAKVVRNELAISTACCCPQNVLAVSQNHETSLYVQ